MSRMHLAAFVLSFRACLSSEDVYDPGFEALLSEDDQCVTGECTLNALQIHMDKPSDVDRQETRNDVCSTGIVAVMKRFAPRCIHSCPQMCQPLATAANAFLAGGASAVDAVVCEHQDELKCIFENYGKCKTLLRLAGTVGLIIPNTYDEMIGKCSSSTEEEEIDEGSAVADGNEGGSECHHGLVGRMYNLYHECFDACSDMCGALQKAAIAMMFGGGMPAARRVVCRYQSKFACPMQQENKNKCAPIVKRAQDFGIILPDTPKQLAAQCDDLP